eukprot:9613748-Heterocapsa_arctica.AAC.1
MMWSIFAVLTSIVLFIMSISLFLRVLFVVAARKSKGPNKSLENSPSMLESAMRPVLRLVSCSVPV